MRKAAHKNKLASTHGAAVPSNRPSLPLNWTPFRVSREYDELVNLQRENAVAKKLLIVNISWFNLLKLQLLIKSTTFSHCQFTSSSHSRETQGSRWRPSVEAWDGWRGHLQLHPVWTQFCSFRIINNKLTGIWSYNAIYNDDDVRWRAWAVNFESHIITR